MFVQYVKSSGYVLRTYVRRRKRGQEANEHIAKDLTRVQGEDISGG
jgi:hypothetical protein